MVVRRLLLFLLSTAIYSAGGRASSTSQSNNTASLTEKVLPTITGVSSTTSDDSYRQGETIAITVAFSENVNVTGTPTLTLETGGSDAVVNYSTGTGTNTLTFNYTIGSGETSSDLDYESTSSLGLNSGTIKDAALNDATLTLASPGAANSLGANKDLIVDNTVPTISSVSLNAANTELTVTFAEDVYNTNGGSGNLEVADFALSISGGAAGVNATPASITKTAQNIWVLGVTITGTANGGETLTVVPAASTAIYDKAGNAASTSQSNNTASLTEKIAPTISAASTLDNDKDGKIDQILVTLSEAITDGSSTLNNTTFTVAGYTVSGTTTGSLANDNKVLITLNESGTADTDATPNLVLVAAKISDAAGNLLSSDQTFTGTADTASPAIIAANTLDSDKDGQIDQILVTLSENINDGSSTLNNTTFTVAGYTVSNTTTGSLANDNKVLITLDESGSADTDATPNVVLVDAKISDSAGNSLSSDQTFTVTTDGAAPIIIAANILDDDDNGQIDQILVTLSEAINDGGSTLDNTTFTVAGYTVSNTTTGSLANDNKVLITLTESGSADTDATPDVVLVAAKISDGANALSSNQPVFNGASNAAPPAISAANTLDSDNDGQIDQVLVTLSETIADGSSTLDNTTFTVAGYTVSGTTTGASANDNKVLITLTESGSADTDAIPNVILVAAKISDGANALASNQTFSGTTDGAAPAISEAQTLDDDKDGQIDQILVTLSEAINDGSSTLDNTTFTVAGYTVSNTTTGTGNDNEVLISLTESGSADTEATPDVVLVATKISDGSNALASNQTFTGTTDDAGPAIIAASTLDSDDNGQIDQILVTLSETIADASSTLNNTTFTVAGYTVSNTTTGASANDNKVLITLNESGSADTDANPTMVLVAAKISDGIDALASDQTFNGTTDGVPPAISAAQVLDSDKDGQIDQILVTLSENINDGSSTLNNTTFTVAGYTVSNTTTGSSANDNKVLITLTESGLPDTDATPDVTLVAAKISDGGSALAANQTFSGTTNGAPPAVSAAETLDNDNDGQIDQILVTLSETIADGSSTLNNTTFTVAGYTVSNTTTGASANDNQVLISLTESGSADTDATPNVVLVAAKISDGANALASNQTFSGTVDTAPPVLLSASYKDINPVAEPDGTVDRVDVIYSEDVSNSAFQAGDWTFPTNGANFSASSANFNGNTIEITVTGAAVNTTVFGATTVLYTANAGIANSIKDVASTPNNAATSSATTLSDASPPIMVTATTKDSNSNGSADQIVVTFSEPVDLSNVDNNNFTLTESAGGSPTINGSYTSNDASSITFNLNGVTANNTSLTINLDYNDAAGTIIDNSSNEMSFNEDTTGSDGVGPTVVITATNGTLGSPGAVVNSGSTTTDVGIILTFTLSEPSSDFDINDIDLSAANGTISSALTVVSSTVYTAHFAATREGLLTTVGVTVGGFTDNFGNANIKPITNFLWTSNIPMDFASGSWRHLTCKDAADGQITVNIPTGGSGNYEYDIATATGNLFDGGYVSKTSNIFNDLAAGTYYPAFRDAADDPTHISYGDAITIREPSVDLDALVSTTQNNILCFGEEVNSGSITITGGVRDITTVNPDEFGIMEYDIDTSPGNLFDGGYVVNLNNTFNYLPAGTYYVGARRIINYDVNGNGNDDGVGAGDETGLYCESREIEITITSPNALTLTVDSNPLNTFGPLCYGEASGQITTVATGGTGTLYYSASLTDGSFNYNFGSQTRSAPFSSSTTKSLSGISKGTWYVSVKDANECEVEVRPGAFVAAEANELSIASVSSTDVSCFGSTNGTISVNMETGKEGAGSLTFAKLATNSQPAAGAFSVFTANGGTFTNIAAGSYYVAVKDANNCVVVSDSRVNVYAPPAIEVIMYKENVSCNSTDNSDGALHATVSGGVAPYTYVWQYDPNDWNMTSAEAETLSDTDHDIINLRSGYYQLTVTDANLCTKVVKNNWYVDNNMHVLGGWGDIGGFTLQCYGDQDGNLDLSFYLDDTEEQPNFNVIRWIEGSSAFADETTINSTDLQFRDNNDGRIRVGDAVYGEGISGLVTVTSITDASNLVLSSPQSIQNGTLLYFGISVTESETGTNLFYRDKDGTPGDQRYYRRDSLGIPNGKISNLGPGKYFATVDNGLGCRKTLGYQVEAPDEILWATRAERPLLAAGVTAIDYITTTRDLRGSQYDLSCVTIGGGTPSILYGATPAATSATVDATTVTTASITSGAQITADYKVYHEVDSGKMVTLTAPAGATWTRVNFASYGNANDTNADGIGDSYSTCNALNTRTILAGLIIGQNTITFRADSATFEPNNDLPDASNLIAGCGSGKTLAFNISYGFTDDATAYDTITGGRIIDAGYYDVVVGGALQSRYREENHYDFYLTNLSNSSTTIIYDQSSPNRTDGTTFQATGLSPGNYSVYATDGYGCSSSAHEFDILGPTTGFNIDSMAIENVSCFGANDGAAKVVYTIDTDPNHPRPADSIKWYILDNSLNYNLIPEYTGLESVEYIPQGSYKFSITDLYGCLKEKTFVITEPALLEIAETVTDVACQTDPGESFGNALNFDPTDKNRIVVADDNSLDMTNALTIEAWIFANTVGGGQQTIVSKTGNTSNGFVLSTSNGWTSIDFQIKNGGAVTTISAAGIAIENGWHHIAATYQSTTGMKIYVDGVAINQTAITGGLASNAQQLTIGAQHDGAGSADSDYSNFFNGSIDELRIWNIARTEAQINYTKETPLEGNEVGLAAYYQFNQGTVGGNNSSISSVTEAINGLNGAWPIATAFDLSGSTSNFVTSYDNAPAAASSFGGIVLAVTGGSNSYIYEWYKGAELIVGQTTSALNNGSGYPIETSGEFTVVVKDANFDCSVTKKFDVNVAAILSLTGVVTPPKCKNGIDGALDITAGGGSSFTYAWTKAVNGTPVAGFSESSEDLSDLGDGTYNITITEQASGCKSSKSFAVASPSTAYSIGIDIIDVTCQGDNDGVLITNITAEVGHPASYGYSWYSGATATGTPIAKGERRIYELAPGPYTMEVTDDYGCVKTSSATVSEEAEMTFSTAITTNLTCHGSSDGAINIGMSGGNGSYTYVWYKNGEIIHTPIASGAPTLVDPTTLTGLTAGEYRVIAQDAPVVGSPSKASCSVQAIFNVTEPNEFAVEANLINPSCQNGDNGQISVVVSGGTEGSGYSYQWIKNPLGAALAIGSTDSLSDLTGDNPTGDDYRLVVTDSRGCISGNFDYTITSPTTTFDINARTTISKSVTALPNETIQSNISCKGASDGYVEVQINVDNGHPTEFEYAWYAGASDADSLQLAGEKHIYDLNPGLYTFQITDFYGCIKNETYTIVEYPTMDLTTTAATNLNNSCSQTNDAAIGLNISGGNTANYSYEWFKNEVIFDPADSAWTDTALPTLASGLYKVKVTDEQGCEIEKSFEVTMPEPLSLSYTKEDNICLGGNLGAISAQASGGTAPYDYNWSLGGSSFGNTDTLSNLLSGDYILTITDFAGCTPLVESITVGGPTTTFDIGFTTTDLTCYKSKDGIVELDILKTGSHPDDYSIRWYKEGSLFNSVRETISGLEVNNYTVVVTDVFGCTKTDSVGLSQPNDIILNPVIDPLLCYNSNTASITLSPTGGADAFPSSEWSLAGSYVANDVLFVDSLISGNYNILVRDARGCEKDSVFIVENPANMAIDTENTIIEHILCQGLGTGSIDFNVVNGQSPYSYSWSQADSTFSTSKDIADLAVGVYDVAVTDAFDCISDTLSFEITEPNNPFNINGDIDEISCLNGSNGQIFISLEVLGTSTDFTYFWNKNGVLLAEDVRDLSNLSSATYVFTATDNFGCSKSDSFTLVNPLPINAVFDPVSPSCFGDSTGSLTVTASGGWGDFEYDWQNPINKIGNNDSVLSNILAGNYLVKVTDDGGCAKNFPVSLNGPDPISISSVVTDNSCNSTIDAEIAIEVTGGTPNYSYQWLKDGVDYATTQDIDSLIADNYELIVTDSLSCVKSSGILEILTPDPLLLNILSVENTLCTGAYTGSILTEALGGTVPYQYHIDSGTFGNTPYFNELADGAHIVAVTDNNNCSTDTLITLFTEYELIADFDLSYTNPYIDWPISFNDSSSARNITSWFWELGNGAAVEGQNTEFIYRAPGVYPITLKITNEVGCEALKMDTLIIEKGYKLMMPSAFTPNNDGLNDVFKPSHENIIQTTIQIYNKYGALVYQSNELDAEWNGDLKEVPLPQDSYLYVIEYVAESGVARTERGRLSLLR